MATIDIAMQSTSEEILSKVANGVEVNLRSPINITKTSGKSATLSGTGKGKLFFHTPSSNVTLGKLVIDGNEYPDITAGCFEVEFSNSFSVDTGTSGTYLVIVAVFY